MPELDLISVMLRPGCHCELPTSYKPSTRYSQHGFFKSI